MTALNVLSWVALAFGCGAMWFARRTIATSCASLESSNRILAAAISERQATLGALERVSSCELCGGWSDVHLCSGHLEEMLAADRPEREPLSEEERLP